MLSAGFRDSEAGVTERYGRDADGRKAWEYCMSSAPGTSPAKLAFLSLLRESISQSSATVIIAVKPPVGIMLN